MRKILTAVAASLAAAMALTACGSGNASPEGTTSAPAEGGTTKLVVGASPVPHAKILEFVRDNLAKDAGLEIQIKEFDDYVLPNVALSEGELDANYFQHEPYLDDFNKQNNTHIVTVCYVHVEPMALYGGKQTTLDAVK